MKILQKLPFILLAATVVLAFTQADEVGVASTNTDDPRKIYTEKCASCHGEKVEAFVDRKWKHGNTKPEIVASITNGYADFGMPSWGDIISQKDVNDLADLIVSSLKTVQQYDFAKEKKNTSGPAVFKTAAMTVTLDTIATELSSPWGFEQMPDGSYLIADRIGVLYHVDDKRNKKVITGTPEVVAEGQGGLLDVILHPKFAENGWIYLSYSKGKTIDGKKLATTAVVRGKIKGDAFVEQQEVFEGLPYGPARHHYGSRLVFGKTGHLFISMGDRGQEKVYPQNLETAPGKIHRVNDDGSIPKDNPFVGKGKAIETIYAYGIRNPQGMFMDQAGILWEHEHGPRGGDELNIIKAGANYGWPVITYGINYDGKPISQISKKEGMEQPITYWLPSIAPSGLTMVTGSKYPAWKGNIMVGSLRFNYVDRVVIKDNKFVSQEKIMLNIGRTRNVEMGRDGYLYVGIENPGTVFRVRPM
jgi:glucose/arabinose dehydrogenase